MDRRFYSRVFAGLMLSGVASAGLPPGEISSHATRLLALNVSTQQDVLELFGPPQSKVTVKTEKLLRYLPSHKKEAIASCATAGSKSLALWKYHNVNGYKGEKHKFFEQGGDKEFSYVAFHADGRVCAAFPHGEDY